jgi:hypothetical protein
MNVDVLFIIDTRIFIENSCNLQFRLRRLWTDFLDSDFGGVQLLAFKDINRRP